MGLTREGLWRLINDDAPQPVVQPMIEAAYQLELHREWSIGDKSPHGHAWHTSFHASEFPGLNRIACGRYAVYKLLDPPAAEPIKPFLKAWFDLGTNLEHDWVRRLNAYGVLLSADVTADAQYQTGFVDEEHWLTGSSDAIVLTPQRQAHCVEIKTTCLTGDTLVAVADGRNAVSLQQLAHEGEDVDVYASDNGATVVRRMRNVHRTRSDARILRVLLDDGSTIRCTPDHRFMSLDGFMLRADQLRPGQSLMRFDSRLSKPGNDKNLRRQICLGPRGPLVNGNRGGRWRWQYKWSAERLFEGYTSAGSRGLVVDHHDGDPLNDRYDNLRLMTRSEHGKKHWANDAAKAQRSDAFSAYWESLSDAERAEHGRRAAVGRDQVATNASMREAYEHLGADWLSERSRKAWETRRRRQRESANHCVISVEFDGFEDTYCGTVEDLGNFAVVTNCDDPMLSDLSGVVVSNSNEKVLKMLSPTPEVPRQHAKYLRQLGAYIGLAHEAPFTPQVTLCKISGLIARPVSDDPFADCVCPARQRVSDRPHPLIHTGDCDLERVDIRAPDDGTLIYSSREDPLTVASFRIPYDPTFMQVGREKLAAWRQAFIDEQLPEHPHEGARAKWSVDPCQYCDFKGTVCKPDYSDKISSLSDSHLIGSAQKIAPNWDYDEKRAAVLGRWGVREETTDE